MAACRCLAKVNRPRGILEPHQAGCPLATDRCAGCGHQIRQHRLYANLGVNRHGSRLVCTVDNCAWTECREKSSQGVTR
jgi:hypothetical protein